MGNPNRQAAFLSVIRSVKPSDRLWSPAADVYTSDGGWLVKVDVAGICHDELTITIEDSLMRISGKAEHSILQFTGRENDRVPGTAFEVTEAELKHADSYEPAPYERVSARLASGRTGWVYAQKG